MRLPALTLLTLSIRSTAFAQQSAPSRSMAPGSPAGAEQYAPFGGTIEGGLFGRGTQYPAGAGIKSTTTAAAGGKLGMYVLPNVALELDAAYGRPTLNGVASEHIRLATHVTARTPLAALWSVLPEQLATRIGAGLAYDRYDADRSRGVVPGGWGPSVTTGLEYRLSPRLALRVDGTGHYIPAATDERVRRKRFVMFGAQAGVAYTLRPRAARPLPAPAPLVSIKEVLRVDTVYVDRIVEKPVSNASPVIVGMIAFAPGSTMLSGEAQAVLKQVAAALIANPGVKLAMVGHADASGSKKQNIALSKQRAENAARFVIEQRNGQLTPDRFQVQYGGDQDPVARNKNREGRASNRRVVMMLAN